MSYTRVLVSEGPVTTAEWLKSFNKDTKPLMAKHKKDKTLKSYSVVQVGEHKNLLITEFDGKAKMNKFVKAMAAHRNQVAADMGVQWWVYQGPVKASG
jgi:hypothetical protein|tara:strand:- start:69 stop:362 length:294 start_codon:yes stop_codon:yes gene_type:complete